MVALHTQADGTVDFKTLSKLIPLRADAGPLQVLLEDDNLIVVSNERQKFLFPRCFPSLRSGTLLSIKEHFAPGTRFSHN